MSEHFHCPECGSTESNGIALVETKFSKNDVWSGILHRYRCAKCRGIIPAHLAELSDGRTPAIAAKEWRRLYRATAPKDL